MLRTSLKTKILFRCDAGKLKEIGTGHLYRSVFVAKILKKNFKLNNSQIKFIIKSKQKYKIGPKILSENKFRFIDYKDKHLKENSKSEIDILKKNSAQVLIFDRWGKTNKKTIFKLRKHFNKIITFDDKSNHNLFDLKINSLTNLTKSKKKNPFENLILPSYEKKKLLYKKTKIKKQVIKVFINLGGWDKNNYTNLILKLIRKMNLDLKIYLSCSSKKMKKIIFGKTKVIYFPKKDFYKNLKNSDLSIVSGGLVMFDSMFLKTPVICLPQDKDQYI